MNQADRLAEILAEAQERRECGESIDLEELVRKHPDLADQLREHLELSDLVDHALVVESRPAQTPARIGEYRIHREIGRGGMGVVYEAEQISMRRLVALKVLTLAFTSSRMAVERFQREARAAGRLHHTNIVPIHDMGQHGGVWYYAMELVVGHSLSRVVRELRSGGVNRERSAGDEERTSKVSRITEEHLGSDTGEQEYFLKVARLFAGVADALETAHEGGVVHRDIKPGNLLLDEGGTLKVVDFGLARLDDGEGRMTLTGDLVGTPTYMSPEQAVPERGPIDHRTDVYSLGATLYEVLTLRPPFRGKTLQAICSNIVLREPESPRRINRQLPRDLETIVLKAMDKDRGHRYQTARALARDLRSFADGTAIQARPIGPVRRAWRRVKRNPVRAALVSAILFLAMVAGLLGLAAIRHSREALGRDYDRRCRGAEVAASASRYANILFHLGDAHDDLGSHPASEVEEAASRARRLFSEAIELLPERPRAWLGRAMAPGASIDERTEDLESAHDRGLSKRTYHLVRSQFLRATGRLEEAEEALVLARRHPSQGPMDAYFEARLVARRGQRTAALSLLDTVLASTGRTEAVRAAALRLRSGLRRREGRLDQALEDLVAVKNMGDVGFDVEVGIAALWRQLGRIDVAEDAFERLLERVRTDGSVASWSRLGAECRRAIRAWHERVTREAIEAWPDAVPIVRERAVSLRQSGRLVEALALCERTLAAESKNRTHGLLETQGWILLLQKRTDDALVSFEAALEQNPNCSIGLRGKGLALSRLGRHEDAVAVLRKALEFAPFNVIVRLNLADVLEAAELWEETADAFRVLLDLQPTFGPAFDRLHGILVRLDRTDEAEALGRTLLETAGRTSGGAHLAGHVHLRLGEREEALAAFERGLRETPDCAALGLDRAQILMDLKKPSEALEVVDAALEHNEGHAPILQARGEILRALGQRDEALVAFDKSISSNPYLAKAYCGRGSVLYEMGKADEALVALGKSIELDPELAPPCVETGRILRDRGEMKEALNWYRRAIEIAPRHMPGHRELAGCLNQMGQSRKAEEPARRALALDPDDVFVHTTLAIVLDNTGRRDEALEHCDRAREIDAEEAEVHWVRSSVLRHLGQQEKALEAARRAKTLAPEDWAPRFQAGHALWKMKKLEEAETELVAAANLAPRNWVAWFNVGSIRIQRGKLEEAIEALVKTSELNPKAPHPHVNRGLALQNLHKHDEAIEAYEKAIELGPRWLLPRVNLAVLYRNLGRHQDAAAAFGEAAEIAPPRAKADSFYDQGLSLERAGEHEKALAAFDLALKYDANCKWTHCDRGISLDSLGRFDDAIRAYERALEIDENYGAAHNNRATTLQRLGKLDEALRGLKRAVELEPKEALYRCNLGGVLMAQEKFDEALKAFEKAVDLQPKYANAHHNRGIALQKLKRFAAAGDAFRKVQELHPREPDSLYSLGWSQWRAGRHEEALRTYDVWITEHGSKDYVYCDRACVLMELRRFGEALAVCREMLRKFPGAIHVRRIEVTCLRALDRDDEARTIALETWRAESTDHHHALDRAYFAAVAGHADEARKILTGTDAAPDPYLRAVIHAILGDPVEVRRCLRTAIDGGVTLPPGSAPAPDLEALDGDSGVRALLVELRGG